MGRVSAYVKNKILKSNNVITGLKIPKLDIVEILRSHSLDITVPGIVVAGAQSSGKSSLLESISGIKLPSGKTITTRVPLILRLQNDSSVDTPYGLLSTKSDLSNAVNIDDISKIPKRINEMTDNLTSNGTVKNDPIHLKVVGKNLPSLTLIDLPGITHLSAQNAQDDIYETTSELVKEYIANENMIILCVIPAVDDFANTEAIRLAKRYDPEGKRTIGVVTKVDMCNAHTAIEDKLLGNGGVDLKLGFIAVRNRTPSEKDTSISQLRETEKTFFATNPLFKKINNKYVGTENLIKVITSLQCKAVDNFLPDAQRTLNEKIESVSKELENSSVQLTSDGEKNQYVIRVLLGIVGEFKSLCNGQYSEHHREKVLSKLGQMYSEFADKLPIPDFTTDEWEENITKSARESQEILLDNFISHNAFKTLFIENHCSKFEEAFLSLVDQVHSYINEILKQIIDKSVLHQYTDLKLEMQKEVTQILAQYKENTKNFGKTLNSSEHFIFTRNPIYNESTDYGPGVSLGKSLQAYSEIATNRFVDYASLITHKYLVTDVYTNFPDEVNISKLVDSIIEDVDAVNDKQKLQEKLIDFENILSLINKYIA
jgi:GTPase SAR1 family protein